MGATLKCLAIALIVLGSLTVLWATGVIAIPGGEPIKIRPTPAKPPSGPMPTGYQKATLGGGCFWCTEAVFQQLNGVHSVMSGYSGGTVKNPTYKQVCTGKTGHAEVIQIEYDPAAVSFGEILEVFWKTHDPTTLNQQGADHGTQYRSAIFYHDEEQHALATEHKKKLDESGVFGKPIVTEITAFTEFWPAEIEHQNFYLDNPTHPYCLAMIPSKLRKLEEVLKELNKTSK